MAKRKELYITETVRMDGRTYQRVEARAKQLGLTVEGFAVYAVMRYMDDRTPMPEVIAEGKAE